MEKELVTKEHFEKLVYVIRGRQVMLDSDLADIYGYEVKYLNRQVQRNIVRFPDDFAFRITREEVEDLWCQNDTANINPMRRTLPYVFSEQGIYMLAAVLKSDTAVQQSIIIMRAFKNMRQQISEACRYVSMDEYRRATEIFNEYKAKTDLVIQSIEKRLDDLSVKSAAFENDKNIVIYKGEQFEADKAFIEIYQRAKKRIYVIDNYVNIKTLHLLTHKKKGIEVIIFTENGFGRCKEFLTASEVADFNKEYPTLQVKSNPYCHDRFVVVDYGLKSEKVYHCGASSKDAGKKVCSINLIENYKMLHPIIDALLKRPNKKLKK